MLPLAFGLPGQLFRSVTILTLRHDSAADLFMPGEDRNRVGYF